MNPDLEVDASELRRTASAVADTAARVSAAADQQPDIDTTPRWATTDAAMLAAEAARQQMAALADDIAETARQISAAAAAYEEADARAATRLRLTR
jgi:ribosomal silencing factor RsfS